MIPGTLSTRKRKLLSSSAAIGLELSKAGSVKYGCDKLQVDFNFKDISDP